MRTFGNIAILALLLTFGSGACTSASPPAAPAEGDSTTKGKKKTVESDEDSSTSDDTSDEETGDELATEEDTTAGDDTADSEDDTPADADLAYPEKLKECHDAGKVYDRRTATDTDPGTCHESARHPSDFECTKAGIIKAFNSSTNIKNYVAAQERDEFAIDQCGTYSNGNPIVFYTKKVDSASENELKIHVVEPQ